MVANIIFHQKIQHQLKTQNGQPLVNLRLQSSIRRGYFRRESWLLLSIAVWMSGLTGRASRPAAVGRGLSRQWSLTISWHLVHVQPDFSVGPVMTPLVFSPRLLWLHARDDHCSPSSIFVAVRLAAGARRAASAHARITPLSSRICRLAPEPWSTRSGCISCTAAGNQVARHTYRTYYADMT